NIPQWPLDRLTAAIPATAYQLFDFPIIRADLGTGILNFCSDDLECSVGIPHTTNPPDGTRYPLVITCRDIKPGTTRVFNVSLRFGPAGAWVQDVSGELLERSAGRYTSQLDWTDGGPLAR